MLMKGFQSLLWYIPFDFWQSSVLRTSSVIERFESYFNEGLILDSYQRSRISEPSHTGWN